MINFINSWIQGIVIAVIIGIIIEMILPEGNNKKYIKVVIGIYILFNIITPVINNLTSKPIDMEEIISSINLENAQTKQTIATKLDENNQQSIKEIYLYNLKNDMKNKIENQGFIVNKIDISIENNEEYTIKKIELKLQKSKTKVSELFEDESKTENDNNETNTIIEEVNTVEISIQNNVEEETTQKEEESSTRNLTIGEKAQVKEYLYNNYQVNTENIKIE